MQRVRTAARPGFTKQECNSSEDEQPELRRGPWTLEEDTLLTQYITRHGEGRWNMVAKCAGLKRTGKSCRLRWLNYLKPDIKRGNLTPQEQFLILELHSKWGNRWSKIAQCLPGRTDNEIKNYWRTRVQKQARQMNIESNSGTFFEAVRCFWMPRLLQKMEQNSVSADSGLTNYDQSSNSMAPCITSSSDSQVPSSVTYHPYQPIYENSMSSSEATSQSVLPIDFTKISNLQQPGTGIPEQPTSPHVYGNSVYSSLVPNDCYYVDSCGYDMEGFNNLAPVTEMGSNYDMSSADCQMVDADWVASDMSDALWNMDDIWQLRV